MAADAQEAPTAESHSVRNTMKHHLFTPSTSGAYPIALLLKGSAFKKQEIQRYYVDKITKQGITDDNVFAMSLEYNDVGKAPVKHIKEYLDALLPELSACHTEYLYVGDSAFFKVLVGQAKADSHAGYVMPCTIKGYEHMKVVLGINYQQLIYNPDLEVKINEGLAAMVSHMQGAYNAPGTGIIHKAVYPQGHQAIQEALNALLEYETLSADIEAFSLRFNEAGIGTIAFAPDKHNFVAFPCDYKPNKSTLHELSEEKRKEFGRFVPDPVVRAMLKQFFTDYKGKLIWHNIGYDAKVIVYTLWMKDLSDTVGMLEGINVMTRHFDDTKLIKYLATNSTAGNVLGLKPSAQEFAGNWAVEDIKDIKMIPLDQLLQYNGVDCLSTMYVHEKYHPIMVRDNQQALYEGLFKDSVKVILQMELTGMPMSKKRLIKVKRVLEKLSARALKAVMSSPLIQMMNALVATKAMEAANAKLKTKQHPLEKFLGVEVFNPRSNQQLQKLLYELMMLPVIDTTDTGQPATGGDTLEKLLNHCHTDSHKKIIQGLMDFSEVDKILSTFIPAFEQGISKGDPDIIWLFGSFNLGGTVSGRLSSSKPNLQNLPATSTYGKLIKSIFMASYGWLFTGADFNSLEDMISALTTKDTNKLKVYTDGFDGHCLRAAYYFKDELIAEGINVDVTSTKSVNALKKLAPHWRQESKTPTFALTYGGTYITMMNNLGWSKEKAQKIELNYHILYVESDEYISKRLEQASKDGYVEVAFGLRLRTPLIGQVVWGASRMPKEAAGEGRTAGNAMGQSYGLLNNRAANAFMAEVWKSEYAHMIFPVALIHDAIYLYIKDDPKVVAWANVKLIEAMRWQELPEIQHPTVKLGAALDIFWPSWANPITIPNDCSVDTLIEVCAAGKHAYLNPEP